MANCAPSLLASLQYTVLCLHPRYLKERRGGGIREGWEDVGGGGAEEVKREGGREWVSTEWTLISIHKHRYSIKDQLYWLNSVLGRKGTTDEAMSNAKTG